MTPEIVTLVLRASLLGRSHRKPRWWAQGSLRLLLVLLMALVGFSLRATPSAFAAGMVGNGTPASCTEDALDAALAGGGMVTFDCGPESVTITLTLQKDISGDTTVDGGGLITLDGNHAVRAFSVGPGVALNVSNLTVANGSGSPGGGINNTSGALTVSNCAFVGNRSSRSVGGAIASGFGTLTVSNSTFVGNTAGTEGCGPDSACEIGGGIFVMNGEAIAINITLTDNSAFAGGGIAAVDLGEGNTRVTVINSTFAGNSASGPGGFISSGGAIYSGATLTVINSTFADNSADFGGGINNSGTLAVTNSTFSGNSANEGGGIYNNGTLTVTNTIVANGTSGGNCSGTIIDGGHNVDDNATCGFTGTGCTSTGGTSFCNTNPVLDPTGLQNNGGPTETIAVESGSPAINAGDESVCAAAPVNNVDQRGYTRPGVGSTNCSIGAYEFNSPGPPAACVGDCLGDHQVTVDEIMTMVNIALGTAPMSECEIGDMDGDEEITVDEILVAVNFALTQCPLNPGQGPVAASTAARM